MSTKIAKYVISNDVQEMEIQEYDLQEFTFKWDQHFVWPDTTRTGAGSDGIYRFGSPVFISGKSSEHKWRVEMDVIPSEEKFSVSCMLVEQCGHFGWGTPIKHHTENDFQYCESPQLKNNMEIWESYFKFKLMEYKNNTITTHYKVVVKSKKDTPAIKNLWTDTGIGKNSNLSDVILRAPSQKEFYLHKIVLASASPVFAAMFRFWENMSHGGNKDEKIVDIRTDAGDDAITGMLEYIYTGSITGDRGLDLEKLDEKTKKYLEVLMLADMYDLPGLKIYSEAYISKNVDVANALEIYKHASLYNAMNLKAKALEFIRINPRTEISAEERMEIFGENSSN